jgi:hypothetical protein
LEPITPVPWLTPAERRRRRNEAQRERQRRRLADVQAGLIEIPHGSWFARRDFGCTCEPCAEGASAYDRQYRAKKKEAG